MINLLCDITDKDLIVYRQPMPMWFKVALVMSLVFFFIFMILKNEQLGVLEATISSCFIVVLGGVGISVFFKKNADSTKRYVLKLNYQSVSVAPIHYSQVQTYPMSEVVSIVLARTVSIKNVNEIFYAKNQALIYVKKPGASAYLYPISGISVTQCKKYYYMISLPNMDLKFLKSVMSEMVLELIPVTFRESIEL